MKKILLACITWFCITFVAVSIAAPSAHNCIRPVQPIGTNLSPTQQNIFTGTIINAGPHYRYDRRYHNRHIHHPQIYHHNGFHAYNNTHHNGFYPSYCITRMNNTIYDPNCRSRNRYMPTHTYPFYVMD